MGKDLDGRLRRLRACRDADAIIELGCDLADAGRDQDAELCFRRAAELGAALGWFNLGNSLAARGRVEEAVDAYEQALEGGEAEAWVNLGLVLEELGDLAGAMRAYEGAGAAGDALGGLQLAFLLYDQGQRDEALVVAGELAASGDAMAAAVVAAWRWGATHDPALEADLRDGQDAFPGARVGLAHLLRETGRPVEARFTLERGAKRGELQAWLPLGNFYAEQLGDEEAAEEAYRAGITAGDTYCHHNLAVLLADRGDLEGAVEHFRLGAADGDHLAAQALRELGA
ncbi:tetratricopeptide repeat protein [Geodermatophilus sabuli]|uniref:Tetratricopeptide repeat-containing protein n=1 Tax=Geodermatophilus sabuli TaxID=1564158 RepID=A0A285EFH4_9ACTN|nr:tetratricopeptide repeat protein [Geodermatophilus sabuli]MBB3083315.1 tetratricopeptide (TPR) repeat protein [Geodermatophilus sabuli]SNX96964.1 Tetratricopeptide repeat-containing protein [Geodermatophilus sabuli]